MLKPYYLKLQAIRITRQNYQKLKDLDTGDGVLNEDSFENLEGDWFIEGTNGYEVMSGNVVLIPINKTTGGG